MTGPLTKVYCVRHALPVPDYTIDRERPLSARGREELLFVDKKR